MSKLKTFLTELKSAKGFTLVEAVVSIAVLSVFIVLGGQGIGIINEDMQRTKSYTAKVDLAANLLNMLVEDAKSYQIDYTVKTSAEYLSDYTKFKNAWDFDGTVSTPEECPLCRGSYAFIIEPIQGNNQLNILTVKIYHPKFTGTQKVKTYTRVIGTK